MGDAHDEDQALILAEGLVNSHLPSGEHVSLDSPEALSTFLEAHGVPMDRLPSRRDLQEIEALRARLRGVFEALRSEDVVRILNRVLRDARVQPRLAMDDEAGLQIQYLPARPSLSQWLAARIAMALAAVLAEEGSDRLRVCAWETCRDVFVDRSRNRSRRFCSPQVCGNRAAVAAWRARQRAGSSRRVNQPSPKP